MGNGSLVGPCFFRQNISGGVYLDLINDDDVVPVLENVACFRPNGNGQFAHVWWAQDGTPPSGVTRVLFTGPGHSGVHQIFWRGTQL